ncbi:MAG: thiamine-phosphate kinase [Nitrososphaerales archaeon]
MIGEDRIIELFTEIIGQPRQPFLMIGDDVATLDSQPFKKVVITSDMLVGSTDVPNQMRLWQASRKAMIMSASDLSAKGVRPAGALVSIAIPRTYSEVNVRELASGIRIAKDEIGLEFMGGDTNESEDLILNVTMVGFSDNIVPRGGAQPGDLVYVTGEFGLTGAGLKILLEGFPAESGFKRMAIDSVLLPRARVNEGVALAKKGLMSASTDSSDGLAISLYHLAESSNVRIELSRLPITEPLELFANSCSLDPNELAFHAGEEYEIVFTVRPGKMSSAENLMKEHGVTLFEIGSITTGRPEVFYNGKKVERRGWMHFLRSGYATISEF